MKLLPVFNKKLLYKWVAILAIIFNALPVFQYFGKVLYDKYMFPYQIRRSYISSIKGDLFLTSLAKKHLDKFNALGNNRVVKFSPEGLDNPREITIEFRQLNQGIYELLNLGGLLGYANYEIHACPIVITDDLKTEDQFRSTLIHEFLHCYGYDHVDNPKDLMYYKDQDIDLDAELLKYAKEIELEIE